MVERMGPPLLSAPSGCASRSSGERFRHSMAAGGAIPLAATTRSRPSVDWRNEVSLSPAVASRIPVGTDIIGDADGYAGVWSM